MKFAKGRRTRAAFFVSLCCLFAVTMMPISNLVHGQTQIVVSGNVIDAAGTELSGVKVELCNLGGATVLTATTSYFGWYSFTGVATGSYNLRLTKAGFAPVTQPITVTTAEQQQMGPITMHLALSLSSTTLGYVVKAGETILIPTTVAYAGEGRETVTLLASAPAGWSTKILQGSNEVNVISLSTGQSLTVQLQVNVPVTEIEGTAYGVALTAICTAQTSLNFVIHVASQAYGTVSGRVVDETGEPLNEVAVTAAKTVGAVISTTNSTNDGTFVIRVQTGDCVLQFFKRGYVEVTKTLTLSPSNLNGILGNVLLEKTIQLTSTIVSLSARPGDLVILPFTARNMGKESEVASLSVSVPQGWTTRVLQGSYEVTKVALATGQSLSLQLEINVPIAATAGTSYNLTVLANGSISEILGLTVFLQGTQGSGTISGRVVDENGDPLDRVALDVSTTAGSLLGTFQSSQDGSFSVDAPIGACSLRFSRSGYVEVTKPTTVSASNPNLALGNVMLTRKIWLTSSIVSIAVRPGEKVTMPLMVSNMGKELEPVTFFVSAPPGWSARVLDPTFELGTLCLSPSGNANLQLELTVPLRANGSYDLSVSAVGDITTTLNFTVKAEAESSSMLSCNYPGKSTSPGESARYQVKLTNPFGAGMRFNLSVESLPPNWTSIVKTSEGEFITEIFVEGDKTADFVVDVKSSSASETDTSYSFFVRAEAGEQNLTDSLPLTASLTELARTISLYAKFPEIAIEAGNHVDYQVSVTNAGSEDRNLVLFAKVPENWDVNFKLDSVEITRLLINGGNKSDILVQVIPPSSVSLGTYTFPFQVLSEAGNVLAETNLTTTVRGSYTMSMGTSTLMANVNSGESTSFTVTLVNNGFTSINGAAINVSLPDESWSSTISPIQVSQLKPRETATFTVTVKTSTNTVSGDYYVSVKGSSEQTTTEVRDIRFTVSASTSWGFIGIGIAISFVALLIFVFRKFRRR